MTELNTTINDHNQTSNTSTQESENTMKDMINDEAIREFFNEEKISIDFSYFYCSVTTLTDRFYHITSSIDMLKFYYADGLETEIMHLDVRGSASNIDELARKHYTYHDETLSIIDDMYNSDEV